MSYDYGEIERRWIQAMLDLLLLRESLEKVHDTRPGYLSISITALVDSSLLHLENPEP